jgi:hypothetical protein
MDRDVVQAICETQSKAFCCSVYKSACSSYIERGVVPPFMVDNWYHGNRNCEEDFKNSFMDHIQEKAQDSIKDVNWRLLIPPDPTKSKQRLLEKNFKDTEKSWLMSSKEMENRECLTAYCPHVVENVENTFHSLFSRMSFSQQSFEKEGAFHVHVTVQPACNNRDIEGPEVTNPKYTGGNDYNMLEYCAVVEGTEMADSDRWALSDAIYLFVKRVQRDEIKDQYLVENLSPYTHMHKFAAKGPNFSRELGVKTLGDHVAVPLNFADVEELFKILTVRRFLSKESKIMFSIILNMPIIIFITGTAIG